MPPSPIPDPGKNESSVGPLLRIQNLGVSFDNGAGPRIQAVDGASMSVYPGQTLAVVGESGCGKSVTALSVLRLMPSPPARFDRGRIMFCSRLAPDGGEVDLLTLSDRQMRSVRGNEIAMIFQEPMTSLNPVFTVGDQIIESVQLHQNVSREMAFQIALDAMRDVGISEPESRIRQYPHQFSGGMRQRVMIAMALACRPRLLLADEPTTALDVTVQAQTLALLRDLRRQRGMGIILITHAMGVVAEQADVVCVMYAGRVVEYAGVYELFDHPLHPYTRGLLASIPRLGERRDRLTTIREIVDNPDEFQRLGSPSDGLRPWWPWHRPPDGVIAAQGSDSVLQEVRPGHWVGLWRTPSLRGAQVREPDLPDRETTDQGAQRCAS